MDEEERSCNCRICQRNAEFRKFSNLLKKFSNQLKDTGLSDAINFMHDILDDALHAEMDRDYYYAILDGSWSEADDIIEHIRSKRATKSLKSLCNDEFVDSLLNTNFVDRLLEKVGHKMHEKHPET